MRRITFLLASMGALMFAVGLSGCGDASTPDESNSSQTENDTDTDNDEHADHDDGEHGDHGDHADADKIETNLALLSDDDRTAAETQKVCLVGDGPLGAMGKPIKVSVKGTDVWICCESCRDALEGDPDKYLAKLEAE